MRAALLSVLLVACASHGEDQAPAAWRTRWIRSAGDGASQFGYGVAVDTDGNVYAIGEFGGTINFGTELKNDGATVSGYIVKLDRAGRTLWSRRIGGTGDASAYAVAVSDHVFVGGYFKGTMEGHTSAGESDAYLLELDRDGATISLRTFGDAGSQAITSLSVEGDTIAIAGDFDGEVDFGGGPLKTAGQSDLFLAALDRSGRHRFSKRFGERNLDRRPRVAIDKASIYFAASYREQIDLGGGPLPSAYDGAFLARFDRGGAHVWSHALPGDGSCFPTSLAVDRGGAVAMGARFTKTLSVGDVSLASESGEDGLLAVVESNGATRFAARYGGFGQDAISGVAFDGDDLYFAGELQTKLGPMTSSGAADAFVARLRGGKIDWFEQLGDDQEQRATRVAVDPRGGVVVIGSFFGVVRTVRSNGGFDLLGGDAFVASFGP